MEDFDKKFNERGYEIGRDLIRVALEVVSNNTDFPAYSVDSQFENVRYSLKDATHFEINTYDYYGDLRRCFKDKLPSNLSDYSYITIRLENLYAKMKEEFLELYNTYTRKGWCRKAAALRNHNNYELDSEDVKNIMAISYELKDTLIKKYTNTEVIVSEPYFGNIWGHRDSDSFDCNVCISVLVKNDLVPGEDIKFENCKGCPYFMMSGVETSHEWVEFFPYCKKYGKYMEYNPRKRDDFTQLDYCIHK